MPIDQTTPNRNYPLPHEENTLQHDVERLRQAFNALDTDVRDVVVALGLKAALAHTHAIGDVVGLQGALDGKMPASAVFPLDALSDVDVSVSENGQVLTKFGSQWIPTTITFGGLSGKPTTLGGYGITDAAPLVHTHDDRYFNEAEVTAALAAKASLGSDNTFGGVNTFDNTAILGKAVRLSGDISPATLSASQNNFDPPDLSTAAVVRVDLSADVSITGLAGGADGRLSAIVNVSSSKVLTIATESGSSLPANQFGSNNNHVIDTGHGILVWYDPVSQVNRLLGPGRASSGRMEAALAEGCYVVPLHQHRHPGHPKWWAFVTVSAGVPTLQTSFGVTSIADTATGQLTINLATAMSSSNWPPFVTVERASTSLTAANLRHAAVRNGGRNAGSVLLECHDGTASTALAADPAAWSAWGPGDQ